MTVPYARPEVSVVIPTRNRSHLLPACLAAALAQEDVELEVVVVDDGSTDATPELLAGQADERVRVVRLAGRHGVARARNIGIAKARGEWLGFLDDDDIWAPRKLRWQLDAAKAAGSGFSYGAAVVMDGAHTIVRYRGAPDPAPLTRALLVRNVIPGGCSNVIARTEVVRRLGGFDERLSQLADRDLWIRLADDGDGAACPNVVVAYRLHDDNMSRKRGDEGVEEFEYLLEKHRDALDRHGVDASRKPGYRYFARAQLHAGRRLAAAGIFTSLAVKERSPADLGRALAAILLGEGVTDTVARVRPRARPAPAEIEVLQRRTPEELEWLRALTGDRIDWLAAPAGSRETSHAEGDTRLAVSTGKAG